jgi:hypothetical protein
VRFEVGLSRLSEGNFLCFGSRLGEVVGALPAPGLDRIAAGGALDRQLVRLPACIGKLHVVERPQAHFAALAAEPIPVEI